MTENKIYEKIEKLLALSSSPNEHEAQAALLKAQELMAKYNITIQKSCEIEYATEGIELIDTGIATIALINIIAKNFKCKPYLAGKIINFYGHCEDVPICVKAFEYAYKTLNKLSSKRYNEFRKWGYSTKGFFQNYKLAFINELKQKFEKQCTALMIVVPPDVEQNFDEFTNGYSTKKRSVSNNRNDAAVRYGINDGRRFAQTF